MELKEIKHQFFALRNGLVADAYHKAGDPHKVVFGLQLPQISALARQIKEQMPAEEIASLREALTADVEVRESRLLAFHLYDPSAVSEEDALSVCSTLCSNEEGEILTFRLLRYLSFAPSLRATLEQQDTHAARIALRALTRFDL